MFMIKRRFLMAAVFFLFPLLVGAPNLLAHVQLNAPNGGETLIVGSVYTIEWEVLVQHETIDWSLSYSVNGDAGPWININASIPPGDITTGAIHTYNWTVPDNVSAAVRVHVKQNNVGSDYEDISDADLAIAQPPTEPTIFTFPIEAKQANACAGTGSDAHGFGLAILNADQTQLHVYVVHDVANPSSAHIHLAPACTNGAVAFSFTGATSPMEETFSVSPADVASLLANEFYVNIHSVDEPAGEIRGQIVQQPLKFLFTLDEHQANAGAGTGSFSAGYGFAELSADGAQLTIDISHDLNSADVTAGHIHLGDPGVNGSAVFAFTSPASPIHEVWAVDTTDIMNLISGKLYANLHTGAFPAGEIRGQIVRSDIRIPTILKEADAGNGEPHGFAIVSINADLDEISLYAEHDGTEVIVGHLHYGDSLTDGPVALEIPSVTSPISATWTLPSETLDSLLAGLLYVNLHSGEYNLGQIRGQILLRDMAIDFPIEESQAEACLGTGSEAGGNGIVTVKPGGREMTIAIIHSAANPTGAHIHSAPQCTNGGIAFPLAQAASPINDIWYLTNDDMIDLLQDNLYVNIHTSAFPAGEIRGQIGPVIYSCGDGNGDGTVNVGDAVFIINYVFNGGAQPSPLGSGNANCDGAINVGDAVYIINYIFKGGSAPCCP